MSPVHGNQGKPFGRPAASSQNNTQWGQQPPQAAQLPQGIGGGYAQPQQGYPQQAHGATPQAPAAAGYGQPVTAGGQSYGQPNYGQSGYGHAAPAGYGQPEYYPLSAAPAAPAYGTAPTTGGRAASYAPQFEPFTPPSPLQAAPAAPRQQPQVPQPQSFAPQGYDFGTPAAPQGYGHGYGAQPAPATAPAQQTYAQPAFTAPQPQSWSQPQAPAPHAAPDARSFDLGTYHPGQGSSYGGHAEPSLAPASQHSEWAQDGYSNEPSFYGNEPGQASADYGQHGDYGQSGEYAPQGEFSQDPNGADLGFGHPAGGELDQGYVDEEAQDYEQEEPSRFGRPMMIAAVLAGAIMLGGGSMYAYKALFGGPHAGDPPVVKSASQPSKVKPENGGGKQFAHTDSKVMGRLGDGSDASEGPDANGTRKVSTLVVGRDGSIQVPQAEPASAAGPVTAPIRVPGLTVVDGLGTSRQPEPTSPPRQQVAELEDRAAAVAPKVVNSQTQKPAPIKVTPPAETTGSIESEFETALAEPAAAPPAAKPKRPKPAEADAGSTSVATTGSGFVAVLASVPRSDSSRMDALKQFADMQQKYGTVLSGKTPDVAEANLGAKGNYHRLVVGPPGSREQASSLCSQLKSQGYTNCWVTSY